MIATPHELQIFEPVISLVLVDVVNVVSVRDCSVSVLPYLSMFKLVEIGSVANPGIPAKHPIPVMPIAPSRLSWLSLVVCPARPAAIDAAVSRIGRLAVLAASAAHE